MTLGASIIAPCPSRSLRNRWKELTYLSAVPGISQGRLKLRNTEIRCRLCYPACFLRELPVPCNNRSLRRATQQTKQLAVCGGHARQRTCAAASLEAQVAGANIILNFLQATIVGYLTNNFPGPYFRFEASHE